MPIALTDQGRRLGELIQSRRLSVLRGLTDGLDKKERKELDRLLEKLLAGVAAQASGAHRFCRLCDMRVCDAKGCPHTYAETTVAVGAAE